MASSSVLRSYWKAGLLLGKLILQRQSAMVPTRYVMPNDMEYDFYESAGSPTGAHILLYGHTYMGERDVRVIRLAGVYASSGLRVVVPVLPGLKSFDFKMRDLEILYDLIRTLHQRFGDPIRITGFSVGAGLALIAAAQPDLRKMVDLLLLFSPHHSLGDVWSFISNKPRPDPSDINKWKIFIWHQMALAVRFQDSLQFSESERQGFEAILQNYYQAEVRAESFYRDVLTKKDMPSFEDISIDSVKMEALSPRGKLGDVKARVLIFHDPYDERYPPVHSERIIAELKQRSCSAGQRLLITPLIAHSDARFSTEIADVFKILSMFSEIFSTQAWSTIKA